MRAKITKPDGTVIEVEGTADEVNQVAGGGAVVGTPIPYVPEVVPWPPQEPYTHPHGGMCACPKCIPYTWCGPDTTFAEPTTDVESDCGGWSPGTVRATYTPGMSSGCLRVRITPMGMG